MTCRPSPEVADERLPHGSFPGDDRILDQGGGVVVDEAAIDHEHANESGQREGATAEQNIRDSSVVSQPAP